MGIAYVISRNIQIQLVMETSKSTLFKYFDPQWLKELSYSEGEMLKRIIDSFLGNMPAMVRDIQIAVNQGSTTQLADAIGKVSSVASLFTKRDLSQRFLSLKSVEDGPISHFTLNQVNVILNDLAALQNEVITYRNLELNSQIGINRESNIRDN
jgi:hypothetical protein